MDYGDLNAETVFQRLVSRSTGGHKPLSQKAPAMSTEYVRSPMLRKARADQEGSLLEVFFPSADEVEEKVRNKHGDKDLFGYRLTAASAAYPGGYGERATKALAREDNVYQLKGTFPTAALALAKLRARVEARQGDVDAVDRIFGKMWGLEDAKVALLPHMHVDGSEATRTAAMEDRAYHALAAHPAFNGGYRVDMATVTSNVLGDDVPINWSRIRMGAKAIAVAQLQGDLQLADMHDALPSHVSYSFTLDLVQGSQPQYFRSFSWERILERLMAIDDETEERYVPAPRDGDVGRSCMSTFADASFDSLITSSDLRVRTHVGQIADLVKNTSNTSLLRTVEIMHQYEEDRALLAEDTFGDYSAHTKSDLTQSFVVPRYKLTGTSVRKATKRENLGLDRLPDMKSHGTPKDQMNFAEFRAAGLNHAMTISGALNFAVYATVLRTSMALQAYKLLRAVKDPQPGAPTKIAHRLRDMRLYDKKEVLEIGDQLFGEEFMAIFETLFRNIATSENLTEADVKEEIWKYCSSRSGVKKRCPVFGGWRDLIAFLRNDKTGWQLFYWARVSIGRIHYAMNNAVLAPIAAGTSVDFLTLMKQSILERARRWQTFYVNEYQTKLEGQRKTKRELKARKEAEEQEASSSTASKYIPPHLRTRLELDSVWDSEAILNRGGGFTFEEHQHIVEMQMKAKFFGKIAAISHNRDISIGIKDEDMREILIESYQGRWYSLSKRLERALSKGESLRLGGHKFSEHPWGELILEFPRDIYDIQLVLARLDHRAWTIHPGYIYSKFQKSVSELWDDIARDIQTITHYITEVEDCLADEQAQADAIRRLDDVVKSMAGTASIPIPNLGYRPPFTLPERTIIETTEAGPKKIETGVNTYIADAQEGEEDEGPLEDDENEGWSDEDEQDQVRRMQQLMVGCEPVVLRATATTRYLSYREIWDELGLGETTDIKMAYAFGLDCDASVDDPHMNSMIGPVVILEDRLRIPTMWSRKLGILRRRLGMKVTTEIDDDM